LLAKPAGWNRVPQSQPLRRHIALDGERLEYARPIYRRESMALPLQKTPNLTTDHAWTVSQLTARIKGLLESEFPAVWVVGEISNLKRHESGHLFLTLKDSSAQISAKIWKNVASRLKFDLQNGLEVIVQGRLSVWEVRGDYSIIIEYLQPKGLGPLELAFRQLYERLEKEGLFAQARKKRLPRFPRRIVLVTSPTGAAVRDMMQVLGRRWRDVEIWLRPVRVQGEGAAQEIADAIEQVNAIGTPDVIIVGRGGGSIEDLWSFNEEIVARAIFASKIPIISAVGHEVDWTIADYVADQRAPTPSAAAELVVPNEAEVGEMLTQTGVRMARALEGRLRRCRLHFDQLAGRRPFRFPFDAVFQRQQRCDELAGRLARAVWNRWRDGHHRLGRHAALIEGLSPLNVLARGYSLTTREDGMSVVRAADQVAVGERIVTRLANGRVSSRVEEKASE